jgi:oxygen-dependent protoporphyrinogen oxidase
MKVIVVGAGTAGLVVTRSLRKRGYEVVTLEKEAAPGGRIAGAERQGYLLDLGAQFFTRYYDTTFEVCRDAGLGGELVDYHLRSLGWRNQRMYQLEVSRDPRVIWRSRGYQAGGLRERIGLARLLAFMLKRRKTIAFADLDGLGELDRQSLAEFAQREFGREVLEYFLQPSASSLSCAQPEDMSAANGISLAWHIISGMFKGFVSLQHGMASLVEALAHDCGDSIRPGTPARRIVLERGAARGVETDEGFMQADAVVCATTATTALGLLPGLPDTLLQPLRKVRYSACCHVMFALDKKIAPAGTYAVSIPRRSGSCIVSIGLDSAKSPRYAPPGCEMAHCFTFGSAAFELNDLPDAEVTARLEREMHGFFPGFPAQPVFEEIYRWREALCFYPPGMATAVGRMERNNYRDVKGLYLCGEYMRLPGTVEGAFRSGISAAEAVAADLT